MCRVRHRVGRRIVKERLKDVEISDRQMPHPKVALGNGEYGVERGQETGGEGLQYSSAKRFLKIETEAPLGPGSCVM